MSIILFIVLGGIVGWIASRLLHRREGLIASIIIGIVGSFIGSFVARLVGSTSTSYLSLNWSGLLWSLIGAIILVALLNVFSRSSRHSIERH